MANIQDVIKVVSAQRIFLDVSRNRIAEERKMVDQHVVDLTSMLGPHDPEVIKISVASNYLDDADRMVAKAEQALKNAEAELRRML